MKLCSMKNVSKNTNYAIVFSIKPHYAEMIFSGIKGFEFRTTKCLRNVEKAYVYATSPLSAIIGEFRIKSILESNPKEIWGLTKNRAGITKEEYEKYYTGRTKAIAYEICCAKKYREPISLNKFGISRAPQSYLYIPEI